MPETWQDLGLNGKRYADYVAAVRGSGLEVVRFRPIAARGLTAMTKVQVLRDLFISGIDCHLRRPV